MIRRKFPPILRRNDHQAEVDAFITRRGVTRCPTACVTHTQASPSAADRAALERYALLRDRARRERVAASRLRAVDSLQAGLMSEVEEPA